MPAGKKEHVIGVDVGGTNIVCAVIDRHYRIISRTSRLTQGSLGASHVLANIKQSIREAADAFPMGLAGIGGFGVGSPGFVCPEEGIVRFAANIPDWKDVFLARILEDEFRLPAVIGHDVDLAALAEQEYGAGRGKDHLVCLTVGTGIGMGMVLNGRIFRGAHCGAGNLGHMAILAGSQRDRNAGWERLERLSAGPAIRAKAIRAIQDGADTSLTELAGGVTDTVDARMVCQAARGGDEVSRSILREAAWYLGIGISNVIHLLDPEIVIIGGGLAEAGDLFFEPLRESVRTHDELFPYLQIPIVPAALGSDAALIGAACIAWEMLGEGRKPDRQRGAAE
jgi:glucokinase